MDECGGCVKKSTKCQSLQTTSLDSLVHHKLPTVNFFDLFFFQMSTVTFRWSCVHKTSESCPLIWCKLGKPAALVWTPPEDFPLQYITDKVKVSVSCGFFPLSPTSSRKKNIIQFFLKHSEKCRTLITMSRKRPGVGRFMSLQGRQAHRVVICWRLRWG